MQKKLSDYVAEAKKLVDEVSPFEARKLAESGEWLVLDVREPDEFEDGHIPGAVNISRGFLEVKADATHHKRDERLQNRNQKVLCYCGGGIRSLMAAKTLHEMGFEEVLSMEEGWTGWHKRGLPEER